MKGFENINISEHCKQRYVERIKDITDRQELRRYIVLYEQDIIQNIRKMLQFGEIIYTGKNFEAKDNKIIHIILNGAWLVFVGKDSQTAITMYKIDLGLDEDFNKDYIQKFLEKLKSIDQEYQEQEEDIRNSVLEMDQEMEECDEKIEEHQKLIRDYENRKAGIKESKKSLDVLNEIDLKRRDIISRLICKKAM